MLRNAKVLALWQRVLLDGKAQDLVIKFRRKLKIPINGFSSAKDFDAWNKKIKKSELLKIAKLFIRESKELVPYQGILKEVHFELLMYEFLYFNEVEEEHLFGLENSDMAVVMVKEGKVFLSHKDKIEDGVYIKLSNSSTIDSVKSYINLNRELIRSAMKFFNESKMLKIAKVKKPKKFKHSPHFKRDKMIVDLSEYSKKEIEKFLGFKEDYKEMAIRSLMRQMGYSKITSDMVKAVLRRRRIK